MSKNLIIIEKNGEIRLSGFPKEITTAETITFFFYEKSVLISPSFDTKAGMFKDYFKLPNSIIFNEPELTEMFKEIFGDTRIISCTPLVYNTFSTLKGSFAYEFEKRITPPVEKKEKTVAPSPVNEKTTLKYVELLENGINLVNFGEEFLAQEEITLTFLNNGLVVGPGDKEPTDATIYTDHENGFIESDDLVEMFGCYKYNSIMPYVKLNDIGYFPDNSNLDRLIQELGI